MAGSGNSSLPRRDIDPDPWLRYEWLGRFSIPSMKFSLLRRLCLAATVAATSLLLSGCSNSKIAPNWYDSAFYKDGALPANDSLSTAPTAQPGNN